MRVRKIFVGGLKETTDESVLSEYFSQFGHVDHVDLIEDRATKRLRGFAYVTFNDYDPVDKAVRKWICVYIFCNRILCLPSIFCNLKMAFMICVHFLYCCSERACIILLLDCPNMYTVEAECWSDIVCDI